MMKISIIGGDVRQVKLADIFACDGHDVNVYGFDDVVFKKAKKMSNISKTVEDTECLILPVPALTQDGNINAPLSAEKISPFEVFKYINSDTIVCAGKADKSLYALAKENNSPEIIDYMQREEFAVTNAAITAEGAVGILIKEMQTTIAGSKILIIGYGRIGRQLALKLRGLNAIVTASARKAEDWALIEADGYASENTNLLGPRIKSYDVIINTVPALVLTKERLQLLSNDCLCLELASKPGGIDMTAASALGIKVVSAPGLPGKTAPVAAAKVIRDTIYNIMYEKGKRA